MDKYAYVIFTPDIDRDFEGVLVSLHSIKLTGTPYDIVLLHNKITNKKS